jgi:hypothetical protein
MRAARVGSCLTKKTWDLSDKLTTDKHTSLLCSRKNAFININNIKSKKLSLTSTAPASSAFSFLAKFENAIG